MSSLLFHEALSSHINRNKDIDPIAKAQLESLSLEWIVEKDDQFDENGGSNNLSPKGQIQTDIDNNINTKHAEKKEEITNHSAATRRPQQVETIMRQINGILRISNDYIIISFHSSCEWEWEEEDGILRLSDNDFYRKMTFRIHASASTMCHPRSDSSTKSEPSSMFSSGSSSSRKELRRKEKVHGGIIKRMKADAYISTLLGIDKRRKRRYKNLKSKNNEVMVEIDHDNNDIGDHDYLERNELLLCEGMVQLGVQKGTTSTNIIPDDSTKGVIFNNGRRIEYVAENATNTHNNSETLQTLPFFEERVYVSDDVLEGIRRALFSELVVTSQYPGSDGEKNSETHCNIAIMELLLDMPYLPRKISMPNYQDCLKFISPSRSCTSDVRKTTIPLKSKKEHGVSCLLEVNNIHKQQKLPSPNATYEKRFHSITNVLAERIALRLLEEVTVSACIKENEDGILDELNISDDTSTSAIKYDSDKTYIHKNLVYAQHGRQHGSPANKARNIAAPEYVCK